ncbi:MAG: monofunctional biosynthetic peptidoglycan transglycosylase [Chlorobiaceae bacterium]|nr:monofunctional biosynthetic peptidoglycan transglycosylase [Chlorobiaceae bacterium]MBA4309463.1 monofunctional biosynthetic peptidoglycan transglycosylase [Chlorobiaceae bacterium]
MEYQFPKNELGIYFEKLLSFYKKNKIKSILLYAIFILYFSLPGFQIPFLEYGSFRFTSLMDQRLIENYFIFFPKQSWVDVDDVNPNLLRAIISMEDGSFFQHKGVDWDELEKSINQNVRRKRTMRGGSTITMQLSKNLFYTTNRSLFRKAKELLSTFRMEKEISKKAILQNYINAIEWGDGIFGIEKASKIYFNKKPSELNINECSRLAAVIPAPLVFQPNKNSRYVLRRSGIIRARMSDILLFPEK